MENYKVKFCQKMVNLDENECTFQNLFFGIFSGINFTKFFFVAKQSFGVIFSTRTVYLWSFFARNTSKKIRKLTFLNQNFVAEHFFYMKMRNLYRVKIVKNPQNFSLKCIFFYFNVRENKMFAGVFLYRVDLEKYSDFLRYTLCIQM